MPQAAVITLNDGKATPVAHSFTPAGIDANGVATFVDRSANVAVGYNVLTVSSKLPSKVSRKRSSRAKLVMPSWYQPTVAGGVSMPVQNFVNMLSVDAVLHEASTQTELKDLLAMFRAYVASPAFETLVLTGEGYF